MFKNVHANVEVMIRRLGLDLDGTLADHTNAKIALASEMGYTLFPKDTSSRALAEKMPAGVYEEFRNRLYLDHVSTSPCTLGVVESLTALRQIGWEFMIVSRRYSSSQEMAREWVQRELGVLIPDRQIAFVEDDTAKDSAAAIYSISAYIDDQVRVLRGMPSVQYKIVYDPFDEGTEEGIVRMRSFSELPDMLAHFFGTGTSG